MMLTTPLKKITDFASNARRQLTVVASGLHSHKSVTLTDPKGIIEEKICNVEILVSDQEAMAALVGELDCEFSDAISYGPYYRYSSVVIRGTSQEQVQECVRKIRVLSSFRFEEGDIAKIARRLHNLGLTAPANSPYRNLNLPHLGEKVSPKVDMPVKSVLK